MLAFLRRLLWIAAWTCLAILAALWLVERSGYLTRELHARLAAELGLPEDRLTIERTSLRWFEPALDVEGVTLLAGTAAEAPEVRLERVHLSFSPRRRTLRSVQIDGGRLVLGEGLYADGRRVVEHRRGLLGTDLGLRPWCAFTDVKLVLELIDGSQVELGTLDLLGRPRDAAAYQLSGRLVPTLGGLVNDPAAVLVDGRIAREGATVHASARALSLVGRDTSMPGFMGPVPLDEFAGRLNLDAHFELPFASGLEPSGALRASVSDGRARARDQTRQIDELALDVDARFEARPGLGFWERDAWDARAQISGRSGPTTLRSWSEFGRAVPDGRWARSWMHVEAVPLDSSVFLALGLEQRMEYARKLLDPRGTVDLSASLLADWSGSSWSSDMAWHVAGTGALGLAFQGVPNIPESGLPIPVTAIHGDLVGALRRTAEPRWRVGATNLEGRHPSGIATGWARITAPISTSAHHDPEFDVVVSTPSIAVDDTVRTALEANHALRWLWPAFSPSAGTASADWRLRGGADVGGVSGAGTMRLQGVALRWSEVPVLVEGVEGDVVVRWSERASSVKDEPLHHVRPFGVAYRLGNTGAGRVGAQVGAHGWVREESQPSTLERAQLPLPLIQEIELDLPGLGLRGRDFNVLATRFPPLGRQVEDLGARGLVQARYHGSQSELGRPFSSTIEVTPMEVEVTPRFFQRRTRIQGRVLIETVDDARGSTSSQLSLLASWPDGSELAARGTIPPEGEARVQAFGTGLDPTNTSFKGALITTLSAGSASSQGFDLSGWELAGPVDFAVEALFDPLSPQPPQNRFRVYLRDNDLESDALRLGHLHGTFDQAEETLVSPLVTATLGGHPVELRDVRTFPLAALARVPDADPWLAREGFWEDKNGRALQADLFVRDLPLDAEHLAGLLSPAALEDLRRTEHWRGALDVLGARLVLTREGENAGKVAMRGRLRPHDLALRLGLPITVQTANVNLEELVLESNRFRGWAHIDELFARIAERDLSGASMIASCVDGHLTVDNLSGEFEEGRLESLGGAGGGASKALGIDLSSPYRFDLAMRLRDVDVAGLLQGVFQSSIADEGVLDASLQLSGTPSEVLDLTGRGTLSLDEGSLWSIPVMRELFLQLGFDRTGLFDRLRARFDLRDGRVRISHIEIRSNLLDLVGRGWQDLDGRLAYDLEVRYGLLDRLGRLNRILYWLNNNLWRVAVRGDFNRPRVTIRNSLLELLRSFDNDPERELPLPGFSALGARF